MALKGDLASVDLAQVFQMLALNKKAGLLSIQSSTLSKVLYFDHRGVTLCHDPVQVLDRVLAVMVRERRLDPALLNEAREQAAAVGGSPVDVLLASGGIGPDDLEASYRHEVEEEIYDLFFCKDARFEFLEGVDRIEGRDCVVDPRFFCNTDTAIMEAARRIDEWSYITERVAGPTEVFVPTGMLPAGDGGDTERQVVLDLVDGRRNVARIVERSGLPGFQVHKHLCNLLDDGLIAPIAVEDIIGAGEACLRERRLQDAISLFEKAISRGVGVPDVHSLAVDAYQAAAEFESAVYHLKCEAEYRIAAGDTLGAATRLRSAASIAPTDLATRERLVELVLGNPACRLDGFDPLREGKELVDLHLEIGDMKRVRGLLERLLKVQPTDLDLKRALVSVHTKAGDQQRVIELYESMADDLVQLRRPIEAIACLQKILMLDRSRGDIAERVRNLYELDAQRQRRRRALVLLGTGFLLLLSAGVGYHFYDREATAAFQRLDVSRLLAADDYDAAVDVYSRFIEAHPLTMAVSGAQQQIAQVEALRQRHAAKVANERAARELELARLRADYKAIWARHKELFLAGNPEAALRAVQDVRRLVTAAGTADDVAWALQEQVEKTLARLQEYLQRADDLGGRLEQATAAGDWATVREVGLQLLRDYELTETAHRVRLPVTIQSSPRGAQIVQDGAPLQVTPAVVLLPATAPVTLTLTAAGFEPQVVTIDARREASREVLLKVVAEARLSLPAPPLSGVGAAVSGGRAVVALRGGRLAVAAIAGDRSARMIELGGLRAVDSTPQIVHDRAFFVTNENTIECIDLATGRSAVGWPVVLPAPPAVALTIQDGRVAFVDRDHVVRCYDQRDGRQAWATKLGSPPAGPVTIDRRYLRVAGTDGRIVMIDVADGSHFATLRAPCGVTTRAWSREGTLFFGCVDGLVRAVDDRDGRILWSVNVGRPLDDDRLVVGANGVLLSASDGKLQLLQRQTGAVVAVVDVDVAPIQAMQLAGDRIYLQIRQPKTRTAPQHDLLQVRSATDLSVSWEYSDQGLFAGPPGIDGNTVVLPTSTGEVVVFR